MRLIFAVMFLAATLGNVKMARAADTYTPFEGEKTFWHDGFARYDFVMDEQTFAITPFKVPVGEHFGVQSPPPGQRRCIVVVPKVAAPGNPWSWQGCYWDHEPQTEVELLRRGFHIVFIRSKGGEAGRRFHRSDRKSREELGNKRWYDANTSSPFDPEELDDEETICAIWTENSA